MSAWFVGFALILPRCTLLMAYAIGAIPENGTPLLLDVATAVVAPRWLIAWWLHDAGWHPLWSILFVVVGAGATPGEQSAAVEVVAPRSEEEVDTKRTPWDFRRLRRARVSTVESLDSREDSKRTGTGESVQEDLG